MYLIKLKAPNNRKYLEEALSKGRPISGNNLRLVIFKVAEIGIIDKAREIADILGFDDPGIEIEHGQVTIIGENSGLIQELKIPEELRNEFETELSQYQLEI